MDDEVVVKSVLEGDRESYRLLVERYHQPLRSLVRNLIGDGPEVDDLAQEAFIRVYRHLDRCAEGSFAPYLMTTAHHLAVDHLRRRRDVAVDDQRLTTMAAPAADTPEDALLSQQRDITLRQLVAKLPQDYRAVVELYYGQDRSVTEVAAIIDQPHTVVKNRLYRARQMLRAALLKEGWS